MSTNYFIGKIHSKNIPIANNFDENDIKTIIVQQKIFVCFRSLEGARIFCRIRSYILSCRKQEVILSQALKIPFHGELPDFVCS